MFPNPQDVIPLPPHPNLEQYKKRAKDLVKACKSGAPDAVLIWAEKWLQALGRLSNSRVVPLPAQVAEFACNKLIRSQDPGCTLADAQFIIARIHGFTSWPKLAKHIADLSVARSSTSTFEAAAEAIISGDEHTLERVLHANPELIRARSTREHGATLLHYVSANGIENYRQRTPQNAARIAEILLNAGAEVDATADIYGGGATTLALVATSIHPEQAGVQEQLMGLLLERGALMNGTRTPDKKNSIVAACLANGRERAANFLANRGARLNLEAAAGLGRLDVVKNFFAADGPLRANATSIEMERGFLWACEYGRTEVIEFLLERGMNLATQANTGQTGLHWAVIGGDVETVKLLLRRGASLASRNLYHATALGQAVWSALNSNSGTDYVPIIETLLEAGAQIEPGSLAWLARQESGSSSTRKRIVELLKQHGADS